MKWIAVFLMLLLFAGGAEATDLYVSTTGDNSDPGDFSHPWLTPKHAWETAAAGDTVYFRVGTYEITSLIDTKFVGNDGTAANPITFKNYSTEIVTFNSSLSAIFEIEKNYNHVEGFICNGGGTFWNIGSATTTIGFEITNCTGNMTNGGDNVAFAKLSTVANNATIRNCTIEGPGLGAHHNTAGILSFRTEGAKICNNEIHNFPRGIYYKHNNSLYDSGVEIAYNYIYNINTDGLFSNTNYANIHDNLLIELNIRINSDNGGPGGDFNTLQHNTLYNGTFDFGDDSGGAQNNIVIDNLIMEKALYHQYSGDVAINILPDYNLYPSGDVVKHEGTSYTLSGWQTFLGGCPGASNDCNSSSGIPTFVGGGSPSSIADYALATGSLGENNASDGKDVGVDTSFVGANPGGSENGFSPDHTKSYYNTSSTILNTINSTGYVLWNRTPTSNDGAISSFALLVTT